MNYKSKLFDLPSLRNTWIAKYNYVWSEFVERCVEVCVEVCVTVCGGVWRCVAVCGSVCGMPSPPTICYLCCVDGV